MWRKGLLIATACRLVSQAEVISECVPLYLILVIFPGLNNIRLFQCIVFVMPFSDEKYDFSNPNLQQSVAYYYFSSSANALGVKNQTYGNQIL